MSKISGKKNPLSFSLLTLPPFLNRVFIKIMPVGNFIAYPTYKINDTGTDPENKDRKNEEIEEVFI